MDSNGSHKLDYNLLGRFLGAGSFGYVFKKNSSVPTAVKIIFKEEVHQQELNRQNEPHNTGDDALSLLHEYNIMEESKTSHPNIVSIFKCGKLVITLNDIGELTKVSDTIDNEDAQEKLELLLIKASRGTPFTLFTIEMELCGQNLRSWLHSNSHRKYDEDIAVQQFWIVHDIIKGLTYLHLLKIMHRDLRPENIMFSYSNRNEFEFPVKLGDFGLARKIQNPGGITAGEVFTTAPGNPAYNAPETMTSDYGLQADLYSLGLVILEILTLEPEKDLAELFYTVKQQPVELTTIQLDESLLAEFTCDYAFIPG